MAGKIIKIPTYYMIVTSFKSYLFIFFSQAHYKGGKVAKLWRYAQRIEMISKRALDMQIWSPLLTWHYHLIGNVLSSQECLYRYVMTSQVMTLSLIKKSPVLSTYYRWVGTSTHAVQSPFLCFQTSELTAKRTPFQNLYQPIMTLCWTGTMKN